MPTRTGEPNGDVARRFLALALGHALADGPLQPPALSLAKRGVGVRSCTHRARAMALHAACHGVVVALVTRMPALGLAEAVVHAATDEMKCRGRITTAEDQAIHLGCKLAWAVLAPGPGIRARSG